MSFAKKTLCQKKSFFVSQQILAKSITATSLAATKLEGPNIEAMERTTDLVPVTWKTSMRHVMQGWASLKLILPLWLSELNIPAVLTCPLCVSPGLPKNQQQVLSSKEPFLPKLAQGGCQMMFYGEDSQEETLSCFRSTWSVLFTQQKESMPKVGWDGLDRN